MAAVGLRNGIADPLGLLSLDEQDWSIVVAALQRAEKARGDDMKHLAELIGVQVAKTVAKILG